MTEIKVLFVQGCFMHNLHRGHHTGKNSSDFFGMSTNQTQTHNRGIKICHPLNHFSSENRKKPSLPSMKLLSTWFLQGVGAADVGLRDQSPILKPPYLRTPQISGWWAFSFRSQTSSIILESCKSGASLCRCHLLLVILL